MKEAEIKTIRDYLRGLPWASAKAMTPEADALARQHIALMRTVLEERSSASGHSLLEAYADAQSPGDGTEGHLAFLRMLFRHMDFRSAPAKEPLILTITSFYFWKQDPDMGHMPNPWAPLMKLYEQGYTSEFNEDEEGGTLDIIIHYEGGSRVYPLVRNQGQ